jgi:hypothetical protein
MDGQKAPLSARHLKGLNPRRPNETHCTCPASENNNIITCPLDDLVGTYRTKRAGQRPTAASGSEFIASTAKSLYFNNPFIASLLIEQSNLLPPQPIKIMMTSHNQDEF